MIELNGQVNLINMLFITIFQIYLVSLGLKRDFFNIDHKVLFIWYKNQGLTITQGNYEFILFLFLGGKTQHQMSFWRMEID